MTHRDLIDQLREPETTDDAFGALADQGEAAFEDLAGAALDPASPNRVRELCAQLLGLIVPRGVERLLGVLLEAEGNDADLAAWGLRWNRGGSTTESVLFDRLTHESSRVRANAARALNYIHVDLSVCDARLIAAARDGHGPVRLDALLTLTRLVNVGFETYGVTDPEPVRAVARESLSDSDPEIAGAASKLLQEFEDERERALMNGPRP